MTEIDRRHLPVLHAHDLFDAHMAQQVAAARVQGHTVPCREGCDACCSDLGYTSSVELAPAVARIRRMSPHRQRRIREQLAQWQRRIAAAGIDPQLAPTADPPPAIRAGYYAARAVCPLLDRERHRCMVYEARPMACRGHWLVDDSPASCAHVDVQPATRNLINTGALAGALAIMYGGLSALPRHGLIGTILGELLATEAP